MDEHTQNQNTNASPETASTESDLSTQAQQPSQVPANGPAPLKAIVIIVLILLVAGAGAYWFFNKDTSSAPTDNQSETPQELSSREYPAVVATVDGEEITREEFQQALTQVSQVALQQGFDFSDPAVVAQVEDQAITILTNRLLLLQAAAEAGIEVTDAEIDEQISTLEAQYGGAEELQQQADALGLDTEALRADIAEQLQIDALIRSSEEFQAITVSDEDVRATYDSLAETSENVPSFADLETQIRAQLNAQAEQSAVGALVERLRSAAEIEISI